jgi:NRAMP (natural resistance-associated macrophage protein)-like metal ion transporter
MVRFLRQLGPGLISGAANDDPSCISTYSVAGAAFGYATLWTSPLCLPLIAAVQLMCSRLGMVTGRGLAGVVRVYYPRWVLLLVCLALFGANVINLGADLGGMAEATAMITGISAWLWTPVYAALLLAMLLWGSYRALSRLLKWLTLALFAYIGSAVLARPDWGAVALSTLLPQGRPTAAYLAVLVGIFGATLSPYLLFWQASQEVEEEFSKGRRTPQERRGATGDEIERSRVDVFAGAFFSRFIAFFITVTTAATLFAHGRHNIGTAKEAAEALQPIAGAGAYLLFALGLIGTGMLAVPVLAGASAHAVSEAAAWRGALVQPPKVAREFYVVLAVSILLGTGLKLAGLPAVKMLFWAAVINGAIAPPLLVLVVRLTSRADVMGEHVNGKPLRWLGWAAVAITGAAALAMGVLFVLPQKSP